MIFGVLAFSFTTSSLSTLITNMDSRNAKLKTRLAQLNSLNSKYNLNLRLYHKLEKVLKYDHSKHEQFEVSFLNEIPQRLKVELSLHMYQKYITKLPFFQEKNGHFIAFVCPMLVQQFVPEKEIIYKEGDPVNEIYFLMTGKVGMVLNVESLQHVFMYIEEGHYFGEIDLISQAMIFKGNSKSSKDSPIDKKRKFTTVSMENCDLLLWSKKNIYMADSEFHDVVKSIFRTAESRLKKAMHAKNKAAEFYNSLVEKTKHSSFKPIITKAHSHNDANIFKHRKENLDGSAIDTISEENEEDDDLQFERMSKTPAAKGITVGRLGNEKETNLSPNKTMKPIGKSMSVVSQDKEGSDLKSNVTQKPHRMLSSLKKAKIARKLSDNLLANLNEENIQNVHFMQIKSISQNFTQVSLFLTFRKCAPKSKSRGTS